VVHQVGHARDARGRKRKRGEQLGIRLRRRRNRRAAPRRVEVVRKPDRDAAARRADERVADDCGDRVRQAQVVDRDVDGVLRRREPVGEQVTDLLRRLPAVGERADVYRAAFARSSALCARFAAW
jgi:hypothetical protein